ncbi:MAG TPA: TerB family tellurite resistance protein [Alphaproteobacteria bacterium]|jgi:uncharacterized tellurite resistance protein B-like protein|nr:TerB family tellurite resistance protein [Alphaproteobacteria bacterium]
MLDRIRDALARLSQPGHGHREQRRPDDLLLAACALLVEAATLDGEFGADERRTILRLLREHMDLDEGEAEDLLQAAERHQAESNQLFAFTRQIKDHYSPAERVEIVEMLWEVAYADGVLHDYEANLLRRVGGLIYVSDRERGEARRRVLERLGRGDDESGPDETA